MNILVTLFKGYGLGDAVQMSAVLRHVRKYRPSWNVTFKAEPGREKVAVGLVNKALCYDAPDDQHYDGEVQIILYDTFANWSDRPNTRVTSCLHERFGIEWDPACARYEVQVSSYVYRHTEDELFALMPGVKNLANERQFRCVVIHYLGDSDAVNKDLSHEQTVRICTHIVKLGRVPLLLDWRKNCRVEWQRWSYGPGGDAEYVCAVIAQCEAFVGIDSGPSKCASATDTPALVVWTGHHPAPFHDPAPNTTHLVPEGYHNLKPVMNDPGVVRFFEENYRVQKYTDLVTGVESWLEETLT